MKMRRTLRATTKWTGAVVSLTWLMLWVFSFKYEAGAEFRNFAVYPSEQCGIVVAKGLLGIAWTEPWSLSQFAKVSPFLHEEASASCHWWFLYKGPPAIPYKVIAAPIWALLDFTAIPTFLMFRTDRRRARIGKCHKCGYSREGLPVDRACPECGTERPQGKGNGQPPS